MEMQEELGQDPVELPSRHPARGMAVRLLANRQLWKNAIYALALITYLCSFLFFGLAVADVRDTGGSTDDGDRPARGALFPGAGDLPVRAVEHR